MSFRRHFAAKTLPEKILIAIVAVLMIGTVGTLLVRGLSPQKQNNYPPHLDGPRQDSPRLEGIEGATWRRRSS